MYAFYGTVHPHTVKVVSSMVKVDNDSGEVALTVYCRALCVGLSSRYTLMNPQHLRKYSLIRIQLQMYLNVF